MHFVEICETAILARAAMLPALNNERAVAQQAQQQLVIAQAARNQADAERNQHANRNFFLAEQNQVMFMSTALLIPNKKIKM